MEAYEFYATPENGTITIPEMYRNRIKAGVKVIVLEQSSRSSDSLDALPKRKSDMLLPPTAKTKGWKFNREEANAR